MHTTQAGAAKTSLRTASIVCLILWAAIWTLFMLLRFGVFSLGVFPAPGPVMLIALATALVMPVVATGLAAAAVLRQPGVRLNWLTLGGAMAILGAQCVLFLATRFM